MVFNFFSLHLSEADLISCFLAFEFHVWQVPFEMSMSTISLDPDSATISVNLAKRSGKKSVFDVHEIYHGPSSTND